MHTFFRDKTSHYICYPKLTSLFFSSKSVFFFWRRRRVFVRNNNNKQQQHIKRTTLRVGREHKTSSRFCWERRRRRRRKKEERRPRVCVCGDGGGGLRRRWRRRTTTEDDRTIARRCRNNSRNFSERFRTKKGLKAGKRRFCTRPEMPRTCDWKIFKRERKRRSRTCGEKTVGSTRSGVNCFTPPKKEC